MIDASRKLIRLFKICLNNVCVSILVGKQLSVTVSVRNGFTRKCALHKFLGFLKMYMCLNISEVNLANFFFINFKW
jgi:hypothetical protein